MHLSGDCSHKASNTDHCTCSQSKNICFFLSKVKWSIWWMIMRWLMKRETWDSFPSLLSQHVINLFLQPFFVVWNICSCALLQHKAAQIRKLIHEVKKLWDVICDTLVRRVYPFQMLLKYFADTFKAFIERFIVWICASIRPCVWLNQ